MDIDTPSGRVLRLAVGCYTEPVPHARTAHGKGVQVLELDLDAATARTLYEDGTPANPAFVQPHPTLPVLYAVSEVWDGGPGTVTALRLTEDWSGLLSRHELPTGVVPAYASVVGDVLVVACYGDGTLASFRLGPAGELVEQVSSVSLSGSGPHPDQAGPRAHCLLPHPYNGFLYAADLGADLVLRVRLDARTGELSVVGRTATPAGAGPRHIVFTPDGDQALVAEELSSTLAVYDVAHDGDLVLSQRSSLLPHGRRAGVPGARR